MQGDFAGGVIDLNTKDIPTENYLTVQLGSGMNTLGTFKPYNDSKNGKKTGWDLMMEAVNYPVHFL